MPQRSIVIRRASALPIKQALVKNRFGDKSGSDEAKKLLAQPETHYVVTVTGIPAQLARNSPDRARTTLNRKDKDPIAPEIVEMHPQNGQLSVIFRLPRANAITTEDREVEFSTKLGPLVIKRKFRLSGMEFNGKLEL